MPEEEETSAEMIAASAVKVSRMLESSSRRTESQRLATAEMKPARRLEIWGDIGGDIREIWGDVWGDEACAQVAIEARHVGSLEGVRAPIRLDRGGAAEGFGEGRVDG